MGAAVFIEFNLQKKEIFVILLLDWKSMTKDEIIEKYGPFDMYDDEKGCYYYVVESDEPGNPQYLIEVNLNLRGRLITAVLITSERLK